MSSATTPAAELSGVVREYASGLWPRRRLRAVDGVDLRVERGDVFGLLGPNRAGKTTLVKMLLSLCKPTAGRIDRLGKPVGDRSTLGAVGYMHENHAFPKYLDGRELLWCYGAMTLVPHAVLKDRVEELLARVGLADRATDPIRVYSKGMVQRLGLAQALLGDPELLVLDEPTEGLDLLGRRLLRDTVTAQKGRGRTTLLVSHALPEVEQLCDRVGVLVRGRVAFVGSPAEFARGRTLEAALAELYEA